jgi:hypothetical protein
MKTSESLFFSQAINACLSVAKSLGASDTIAYELAVNATTESFCKVKSKVITTKPIFSDDVYRIICDEGLKGATIRFIFRKIRCLRDVTVAEKKDIVNFLLASKKIYSKTEGQKVTYHAVI